MKKEYDLIIYIGRFQPVHLAHVETIKRALSLASTVLILKGSANQPRTIKNPWTWQECAEMITLSLPEPDRKNVIICPLRDVMYNDQTWAERVQSIVMEEGFGVANYKIKIIGHTKDESSFYLKMFPQWGDPIEMENIEHINATDIREMYFSEDTDFEMKIGRNLSPNIHDYLKAFQLTEHYENLVEEFIADKKYKEPWKNTPYPVTFVTVDAVVIKSGHVLLVRRRARPGKGLFAMPGGFLNAKETIVDSMIRELREETKIKVPEPVLRGNIKAEKVFDKVDRSLRGRTITHAFLIELPPGELPKVKGSDDADKAKWVPFSVFEKMEDQMFEDHYHIIKDLKGKL